LELGKWNKPTVFLAWNNMLEKEIGPMAFVSVGRKEIGYQKPWLDWILWLPDFSPGIKVGI